MISGDESERAGDKPVSFSCRRCTRRPCRERGAAGGRACRWMRRWRTELGRWTWVRGGGSGRRVLKLAMRVTSDSIIASTSKQPRTAVAWIFVIEAVDHHPSEATAFTTRRGEHVTQRPLSQYLAAPAVKISKHHLPRRCGRGKWPCRPHSSQIQRNLKSPKTRQNKAPYAQQYATRCNRMQS